METGKTGIEIRLFNSRAPVLSTDSIMLFHILENWCLVKMGDDSNKEPI